VLRKCVRRLRGNRGTHGGPRLTGEAASRSSPCGPFDGVGDAPSAGNDASTGKGVNRGTAGGFAPGQGVHRKTDVPSVQRWMSARGWPAPARVCQPGNVSSGQDVRHGADSDAPAEGAMLVPSSAIHASRQAVCFRKLGEDLFDAPGVQLGGAKFNGQLECWWAEAAEQCGEPAFASSRRCLMSRLGAAVR